MPLSNAENQRRWRKRQKKKLALLEQEVRELRAEVKKLRGEEQQLRLPLYLGSYLEVYPESKD